MFKKIILATILVYSLAISFIGGFSINQPENEFYTTKTSKSYFLYSIYSGINRIFKSPGISVAEYAEFRGEEAPALYIVNPIFHALGVISMFLLVEVLLGSSLWALIATFFFASSFYWIVESHYANVDMPMTALSILAMYSMFGIYKAKKMANRKLRLGELALMGFLIGLAASAKYSALLLYLIYIVLFIDFKSVGGVFRFLSNIVSSCIISSVVLAVFMADKFPAFIKTVNQVFSVHYGKIVFGYTFFEDGYFFHITKSFFYNYGVPLTLLALAGSILALVRRKDRRRFIALFLYIFAVFTFHAGSVIKAHSLVLPCLPVFAFFSVFPLIYLVRYLRVKFGIKRLTRYLLLGFLALILSSTNIANSFKLSELKQKPSTYEVLTKLIDFATERGYTVRNRPMAYFLSVPKFIVENNFRPLLCRGPKIDIQDLALPGYRDILVLDAKHEDKFVYDPYFNTCLDPEEKIFTNYKDLLLIKISPFNIPKERVTYVPEQAYSPRSPNLHYQELRGPYIEVFLKSKAMYEELLLLCEKEGFKCEAAKGEDSFYMNNMNRLDFPFKVKAELLNKVNYD